MDPFGGFEPQVGEIRAVRSFRIGIGGVLYPLFSAQPWSAEENLADCLAARPHRSPDPDCTCGFYAYATADAASEYAHSQHVLAVVSCWGQVIAGTRGLRAERARIDAIWMGPAVPVDLAGEVRDRYHATEVYADRDAMLAEHPPTVLDCYELESPREQRWRRITYVALVVGAVLAGILPASWIGGNADARIVWGAELAFFVAGALVLRRRRADVASRRRAVVFFAVVLWLLAPFAGSGGVLLLRLPLIQVAALTVVQRDALRRAAAQFPVEIR